MVLLIMGRACPGIPVLLLLIAALAMAAPARAQDGGQPRVLGAELAVRDGWLVAQIRLSGLIDQRTASTIDSGLPGICAYEVVLRGPDGGVRERLTWTVRLEHDIWEDRYLVRGPDGAREVASIAAMDSAAAHVADLRILPVAELRPEREYRLEVSVEVLPLGAEAEDRLTRYLSRRGGGSREELDVDLGSLFSRVFGGGGGGGGRTSIAWTGPGFRPRALDGAAEGSS